MSKFEDSLWRDLVDRHGSDLEQMAATPEGGGGPPRRRLLAGTSLGLAGAGTAAVLIVSAASSAPAFAVSRNADGTVTVLIRRIEGISGANERLHKLGIRVQAVQVAAGCSNIPPALALVHAAASGKVQVIRPGAIERFWRKGNVIVTAKINPGKIPAGRTIVLPAAASFAGKPARVITVAGRGAVPACLPILPPAAIAQLVCPGRATVTAVGGAGGPVTVTKPFTNPTIRTGTSTTDTGTTTTGTSTKPTGPNIPGRGHEVLPPGASTAPFRTSTGPTTTTGTTTSNTTTTGTGTTTTDTTTTGTGTTTTGTGTTTGPSTSPAPGPGPRARFSWSLAPAGCQAMRSPAQMRKVMKALTAARAARLKALEKAAKAQKR